MAADQQIHDYDRYEFIMTDVTGKKFTVSMSHNGSCEEIEEFFLLAAKVAGFGWVKNVYLIPSMEDSKNLNNR